MPLEKELTPREKAKEILARSLEANLAGKAILPALFSKHNLKMLEIFTKYEDLIYLLHQYWFESLGREEKLENEIAKLKGRLVLANENMASLKEELDEERTCDE